MTDARVAKEFGITTVAFSYAKRKDRVPIDKVAAFCAKYRVSINWVLYDQLPESLHDMTESIIRVKYFKNINASAGGGAINEREDFEYLRIDKEIANLLGGVQKLKDIESIKVYGDSMEPLLKNGAIVFIDTTKKEMKKDGVFVLNIDGLVFIKKVDIASDGSLDLISENSIYPVENVALDEHTKVVGKVIGSIEGV